MTFKLRGAFKRARLEYNYITCKNWSFQDAGEFWDNVHDYDEIDEETYAYKRRFYDSIRLCSIKDNSRVLDIDCRTGNGTVFYHGRGKVKSAVCISPSRIFLSVAKKRLKKHGISAETMQLKKLPLDLLTESFDAVLCFETIEHISSNGHIPFLKELNRLLGKDGEMILTMPNLLWGPVHWFAAIFDIHHSEGPHKFLSRKKIKALLKEAGFKIIKEETTVIIPAGPKLLIKAGEVFERLFKRNLMVVLGLRRIFVCRKA